MTQLNYRGPARPLPTWRRPLIDYVEVATYIGGVVVLALDLFYWRF